MKMSDEQFVKDETVLENGGATAEEVNNEETETNGMDQNGTEETEVATESVEETNGEATELATNGEANTNGKADKAKNSIPEYFRKVFVGSLNYTTTEETMREHFSKFGEIVDCVIMKESKSGKSRGFGFVTYQEQAMVDELMKGRPHKLDGRELETKRATPREEAGKPGAEISTKKLFVGAIKEGLTEEHLKEYFGKYGNIEDCIVMKDKESGKPRGFGFVSFDDYDPIDKIVLEKNHTVNNQAVAVKKALPKDQTNNNGNQKNNNGYNNNHNGYNNNNNRNNNRNNNNNNNGRGNFNNNNRNNNNRFNNNHNNNGQFNNNNFNGNGGYNNFNGNNNGNGNFNGNNNGNGNFNGNGQMSNNGNGMPGFNFALIAQKMLQAAQQGNGNGPQNGNFNGNGNNFNGNGNHNMNGNNRMNGQQQRNGGGPMRGNQNRGGGRTGPYGPNKQKQNAN